MNTRTLSKLAVTSLLALSPMLAFATPDYYVTGQLGGTIISDGTNKMYNWNDNPSGVTGRVALGYLDGNAPLNYGLEAGLQSYHATWSDSAANLTYNGYNIDLLGVLRYSFNSGINVFGKGGIAYVHQKQEIKYKAFNLEGTQSGNKFAPELALGVGYQFTPQVEVSLSTNTVFAGSPSNSNPVGTNSSFLLGLTYHFA